MGRPRIARQTTCWFQKNAGVQSVNATAKEALVSVSNIKIDIGCGKNKQQGFVGIDRHRFDGVDGVTDLTMTMWVFDSPSLGELQLQELPDGGWILPDSSVSEAHCSHFLEHLHHNQEKPERTRFMNELYRILAPGGKCTIITPHWASQPAYGDFTHADKPVCEFFYYYLVKEWRIQNARSIRVKHIITTAN